MSECAGFRELMLEAEPAELRGRGDTPLARHLASCASCRRTAAVLLEETARLDGLLSEAPPLDVEALIARAREGAGAPGAAPAPGVRRLPWRPLPRRLLWVPVAAAAALAALLLLRAPDVSTPPASMAARPIRVSPPVVEPAPGQDAAIMPTDDPDITVVWLFKTG